MSTTAILNTMNHHHWKTNEANEAERREEHRELRDPIGNTRPRESHSTMINPGFGGPLSHHDQNASRVPSSSDRKIHAMPELSQMPPPPQPTIEISPGVHLRLRGADETWKAIANDYYMPAECICCESAIFCIQDADYVLCPDCRVVSLMEGPSSRGMGGVGLGFKYEDLARWQEDILRDQCRCLQAQF
jgi:hypothetical protein